MVEYVFVIAFFARWKTQHSLLLFPAVLLSVVFFLACFSSHFADSAAAFVFARWTPYSWNVHVIDWGFNCFDGCGNFCDGKQSQRAGFVLHTSD